MMPVLAGSTSAGLQPSAVAAAVHMDRASASPRGPVATLELPLLQRMARARPPRRCFLPTMTGAPSTRLVVNTPAAVHGPSAAMRQRSDLPLALTPAVVAAARKPWEAVRERAGFLGGLGDMGGSKSEK